ncbi:hypothetical protein D3C87_2150510 [compost metagenome]
MKPLRQFVENFAELKAELVAAPAGLVPPEWNLAEPVRRVLHIDPVVLDAADHP